VDKHGALHWWNDLMPVHLYVWDSHKERSCELTVIQFDALIPHADIGVFDETKPYFAVPADLVFEAASG
jgi:hypothetical protein